MAREALFSTQDTQKCRGVSRNVGAQLTALPSVTNWDISRDISFQATKKKKKTTVWLVQTDHQKDGHYRLHLLAPAQLCSQPWVKTHSLCSLAP